MERNISNLGPVRNGYRITNLTLDLPTPYAHLYRDKRDTIRLVECFGLFEDYYCKPNASTMGCPVNLGVSSYYINHRAPRTLSPQYMTPLISRARTRLQLQISRAYVLSLSGTIVGTGTEAHCLYLFHLSAMYRILKCNVRSLELERAQRAQIQPDTWSRDLLSRATPCSILFGYDYNSGPIPPLFDKLFRSVSGALRVYQKPTEICLSHLHPPGVIGMDNRDFGHPRTVYETSQIFEDYNLAEFGYPGSPYSSRGGPEQKMELLSGVGSLAVQKEPDTRFPRYIGSTVLAHSLGNIAGYMVEIESRAIGVTLHHLFVDNFMNEQSPYVRLPAKLPKRFQRELSHRLASLILGNRNLGSGTVLSRMIRFRNDLRRTNLKDFDWVHYNRMCYNPLHEFCCTDDAELYLLYSLRMKLAFSKKRRARAEKIWQYLIVSQSEPKFLLAIQCMKGDPFSASALGFAHFKSNVKLHNSSSNFSDWSILSQKASGIWVRSFKVCVMLENLLQHLTLILTLKCRVPRVPRVPAILFVFRLCFVQVKSLSCGRHPSVTLVSVNVFSCIFHQCSHSSIAVVGAFEFRGVEKGWTIVHWVAGSDSEMQGFWAARSVRLFPQSLGAGYKVDGSRVLRPRCLQLFRTPPRGHCRTYLTRYHTHVLHYSLIRASSFLVQYITLQYTREIHFVWISVPCRLAYHMIPSQLMQESRPSIIVRFCTHRLDAKGQIHLWSARSREQVPAVNFYSLLWEVKAGKKRRRGNLLHLIVKMTTMLLLPHFHYQRGTNLQTWADLSHRIYGADALPPPQQNDDVIINDDLFQDTANNPNWNLSSTMVDQGSHPPPFHAQTNQEQALAVSQDLDSDVPPDNHYPSQRQNYEEDRHPSQFDQVGGGSSQGAAAAYASQSEEVSDDEQRQGGQPQCELRTAPDVHQQGSQVIGNIPHQGAYSHYSTSYFCHVTENASFPIQKYRFNANSQRLGTATIAPCTKHVVGNGYQQRINVHDVTTSGSSDEPNWDDLVNRAYGPAIDLATHNRLKQEQATQEERAKQSRKDWLAWETAQEATQADQAGIPLPNAPSLTNAQPTSAVVSSVGATTTAPPPPPYVPQLSFADDWHGALAYRRRIITPPAIDPENDPTIRLVLGASEHWIWKLVQAFQNIENVRDREGSADIKKFEEENFMIQKINIEAACRELFVRRLPMFPLVLYGYRGNGRVDRAAAPEAGLAADRDGSCHDRIRNIVNALKFDKRICRDILNDTSKLEDLVNAPLAYAKTFAGLTNVLKTKDSNAKNNDHRTRLGTENKKMTEENKKLKERLGEPDLETSTPTGKPATPATTKSTTRKGQGRRVGADVRTPQASRGGGNPPLDHIGRIIFTWPNKRGSKAKRGSQPAESLQNVGPLAHAPSTLMGRSSPSQGPLSGYSEAGYVPRPPLPEGFRTQGYQGVVGQGFGRPSQSLTRQPSQGQAGQLSQGRVFPRQISQSQGFPRHPPQDQDFLSRPSQSQVLPRQLFHDQAGPGQLPQGQLSHGQLFPPQFLSVSTAPGQSLQPPLAQHGANQPLPTTQDPPTAQAPSSLQASSTQGQVSASSADNSRKRAHGEGSANAATNIPTPKRSKGGDNLPDTLSKARVRVRTPVTVDVQLKETQFWMDS
ncbi:uncharacterized protein BDR25DRAFT_358360 [Lindgomyces ingoldianus]|uniref:Uncharacterized protein n=1 Tax=Lindgomyces ingoldianus TaxID=673940 RepID=A0ACB6QLB0_9PLEO|nr:uncharacterized protein BDR25DRAFT_358360 [Lindgomyces ingoldianus]KAF2467681.1 hypothetical protein BDR25DRAFT_358360 [Lindgomyces ingoldianus]